MTSSDIDSKSLQAVKNLRSRFEQLASGTFSDHAPTGNGHLTVTKPSSSSPRRSSSNSQLDGGSASDTGHIRTSSSSSDFQTLVKRPPPPPPPSRSPNAKGPPLKLPSPQPSPGPRSLPIPVLKPDLKDVDAPPSVSALRSRL